ncbi:5-formyltetrahydrofolate cyclo-ligase [Anaerotignum lactatifermentans]|uniref:5-formyltetrahydrofolate cyclo-ligase n=1 Tax=Anaerotignum lactatifermentans TaxID=160404 RepID=A0ABS2G8N5_9FIRM|nr:5-formyltetrahydrofolate cyclo-ligase [Anaerotignum lactatifermentans]MBM6828870.1 5-formyltetrahydrofolate cyclo-ligase [Anaerotignum lactatifermentans]MBM6876957.1 5-formyltetrahydrofolate cyclo-ligase [Anaerotignum lactatifermentans]MBM6950515.1 5-formyltetrahydrofolate cyclo-ligase [Anaerotignum lactatifermentans]
MSVKEQKKAQRKWVKEKQKMMALRSWEAEDRKICEGLLSLAAYRRAKTIFCFVSMPEEIDTDFFLQQAWKDGKRVVVPRCGQKGVMAAYEVSSLRDLEAGQYGIREPKAYCALVAPEEIDFGVIPCLSCDRKGFRLGHGGGYYDRYLEGTNFPTAVICREELLLEETAIEPFDTQMDWVITEKEIMSVKKGHFEK